MIVESSTPPSGDSFIGPQSGDCACLAGGGSRVRRAVRARTPAVQASFTGRGAVRRSASRLSLQMGIPGRNQTANQASAGANQSVPGGRPRLGETGASRP